jgi:hypothetical protein
MSGGRIEWAIAQRCQPGVPKWITRIRDCRTLVCLTKTAVVGSDYALIKIEVTNPRAVTSTYESANAASGANAALRNSVIGKTWGADDPRDTGLRLVTAPAAIT